MNKMIRHATAEDLDILDEIYENARKFMASHGNPNQWVNGHPNRQDLMEELEKNQLYVIIKEDVIQASFVFFEHDDPTYSYIEGKWCNDEDYVVVHKVATRNLMRGMGTEIMNYAKSKHKDVRIDTHQDNVYMQNVLKKNGFVRTGIIYLENGAPRIAFQYVNKQD